MTANVRLAKIRDPNAHTETLRCLM